MWVHGTAQKLVLPPHKGAPTPRKTQIVVPEVMEDVCSYLSQINVVLWSNDCKLLKKPAHILRNFAIRCWVCTARICTYACFSLFKIVIIFMRESSTWTVIYRAHKHMILDWVFSVPPKKKICSSEESLDSRRVISVLVHYGSEKVAIG